MAETVALRHRSRYAPEAVERVVAAMRNPDDKIAVPAELAQLDRGYGRPNVRIERHRIVRPTDILLRVEALG